MTSGINTFAITTILITTLTMITSSCGSSKSNLTQTDATMQVKMTVNFTSDYCGGAYPSDEILEAWKKERPLSKKKFYVLKVGDELDQMMEMSTATDGTCSMELEPGQYQIFLPEKRGEAFGKFINKEQCETWKKTPNGTFEVTNTAQELTAKVHKTCSPCQDPPR